jgi:hypothetical protein
MPSTDTATITSGRAVWTTGAAPLWTIEAPAFGIEVVFGSNGYDTDDGYRLTCAEHAQLWGTKGPAVKVAQALGAGWAAVRVHTAFRRGLWAAHRDVGGGFLTRTGYATARARRAGEHFTRTFERSDGDRYVTKSNGSCGRYRPETVTSWVCTCGAGGFGENRDRTSAQQRAAMHRADPSTMPGEVGWSPATVEALRASRAI